MQTSTALPGREPPRAWLDGLRSSATRVPPWGWALVLLAAFAIFFAASRSERDVATSPAARAVSAQGSAAVPGIPAALPTPQDLMPIAPEDALEINAARPNSTVPVEAAAPLAITAARAGLRDTALQCLTSALYYEAASEPEDGLRAVAQVILNRVRHPAYPSSVCGVVYQGSERVTGCQFSFTCDGSLARVPSTAGWARSRRLAEAALSGRVFAPVGHATHYHADYVVPYWASSLDKVQTIGRHIFYRWSGRAGRKSAFRQRYAGVEQLPTPYRPSTATPLPVEIPTAIIASAEPSQMVADDANAPKLAEPRSTLKTERKTRELLADLEAGKLVAPTGRVAGRPADPAVAAANTTLCDVAQPAAPVQPIGGAVSRTREAANGCS